MCPPPVKPFDTSIMKSKLILFLLLLTASFGFAQRKTLFGVQAGLHISGGQQIDSYQNARGIYEGGYGYRAGPILGLAWQRSLNSWLSFNWGVNYANYGYKSNSRFETSPSYASSVPSYNRNESTSSHFIEIPFSINVVIPVLKQQIFFGPGLKPSLGFASTYKWNFEDYGASTNQEEGKITTSAFNNLGHLSDHFGTFAFFDLGMRLKGGWEAMARVSVGAGLPSLFTCPEGSVCMMILYRKYDPSGAGFMLRKFF